MRQRINLLLAIREKELRQREFARIVGAHESVVSEVISGKRNLDLSKQVQWAKALDRKPEEIFSYECRDTRS
jgi:transcriptional regulator with XRE-family HTH domain